MIYIEFVRLSLNVFCGADQVTKTGLFIDIIMN